MAWHYLSFDIPHFVLGALYLGLSAFSIRAIFRIVTKGQKNSNKKIWQKLFHPLFLLGCLIRATFFVLAAFIREDLVNVSNKVNLILNSLPSFLFFSVYFIIVFLWAEIYHSEQAQSKVENVMPIIFVSLSCLQYGALSVLYCLDIWSQKESSLKVAYASTYIEKAIFIYDFSMYPIIALAYITYTVLIHRKFLQFSTISEARKNVLFKIYAVTILITICFCARSAITAVGVWKDLSVYWWFDITYFGVLEVIPLIVMFRILHQEPKREERPREENSLLVNSSMIPKTTWHHHETSEDDEDDSSDYY